MAAGSTKVPFMLGPVAAPMFASILTMICMLLFMIFPILVFNLYRVTGVTIVLLALLSGAAILSVARDRGQSPDEPHAWNVQDVRGTARTLSLIDESLVRFSYLGQNVFQLSQEAM